MARFLIDENLPRSLKAALNAAGLQAEEAYDAGVQGRPDSEVLAYATKNAMALITRDVGIGNIQRFPLGTHRGIVLIRFPNRTPAANVDQAIVAALRLLPDDDLDGNVVVLDPSKLRIHRKP
jgi:predicted nuclease of predicted toxin-antitoxin system